MRLQAGIDAVRSSEPMRLLGRVVSVTGIGIRAHIPQTRVGGLCELLSPGRTGVRAEVVGFDEGLAVLMPLGEVRGHGPGSLVRVLAEDASMGVGEALLGRVIDAFGQPLDMGPPPPVGTVAPLYREPPAPLERKPVEEKLDLGVRAMNGLTTVGRGQRLAIIAGSGVGKSTLLGMIARHCEAEVKVVALIGERGREVREFLERDLGDGLAGSVVVVATSDKPALIRIRAAYAALAVAEYFRETGRNVLFLMDALTRFAMAQREIGLAAGEPPTAKGYTPSVFAMIPGYLERVANDAGDGSLTGLFTVLAEEDDLNDPIVDAVRAVTDGQVVLSRSLAVKNHYPAIDIGHSISRTMHDLTDREHVDAAGRMRGLMAELARVQELMEIGAYHPGANPDADLALSLKDRMFAFLKQRPEEYCSFEESRERLLNLVGRGN